MAAAQVYFSTMVNFNARITTGVTNTDGSGSLISPTWWSTTTSAGIAPTTDWLLSGLLITASSATGVGDPADSILQVYAINKASSAEIRKFYTHDIGNPAAGSTTVGEYQLYIPFGPSYTFMANTDLRFSLSVTTTAGNVDVFGFVMVA
jgi:hypothetical protein